MSVILVILHEIHMVSENLCKDEYGMCYWFQCLKIIFSRVSGVKLKEGIFVFQKIRKIVRDLSFNKKLNKAEKEHGVLL